MRNDIEELILSNRIKVFKLDKDLAFRLTDPADTLYSSRQNTQLLASDPVTLKRNQLAEEFGQDIATRWLKKEGVDQKHWDRWLITREAIEVFGVGAEVVDTVIDLVDSLYQIEKIVVTITGKTIKAVAEFYYDIATGDLEGIREDLKAAGIFISDTIDSAEKLIQLAKQGLEIFNQLQDDPQSRDLVIDYFSSLFESIPYRDSRTIGIRIVAEIGLEVLLALATAGTANIIRRTGQVGLKAVQVGKNIERIGPFTHKSIELLNELAKRLNTKNVVSEQLPPPQNPKIPEHAKSDRPGLPKPRQLEKQKVPCFKKNKKGTDDEYDRQLEGQKDGLNEMTAQEYLDGRKAYADTKRSSTQAFRKKYKDDLIASYTDLSKAEANAKATEVMKTLHALHNPDMIAAGKDVVTDMGDGSVNQSIGSQWNKGKNKEGLTRVEQLDKSAQQAVADGKGDFKMNADLHRCK